MCWRMQLVGDGRIDSICMYCCRTVPPHEKVRSTAQLSKMPRCTLLPMSGLSASMETTKGMSASGSLALRQQRCQKVNREESCSLSQSRPCLQTMRRCSMFMVVSSADASSSNSRRMFPGRLFHSASSQAHKPGKLLCTMASQAKAISSTSHVLHALPPSPPPTSCVVDKEPLDQKAALTGPRKCLAGSETRWLTKNFRQETLAISLGFESSSKFFRRRKHGELVGMPNATSQAPLLLVVC